MKRLLALLICFPLLAIGAGAHVSRQHSTGANVTRLPAGVKFYAQTLGFADGCTGGDGQSGGTSIDTATYGGSGAGNLFALVDGISIRLRWVCGEPTQGNYDDSKINVIIDQVAVHGGKFGLDLFMRSYQGASTHSNVPPYIYNDFATYGGTSGHGGEICKSGTCPGSYLVIFGNANVTARTKAWIDHLAASYGPNSSRPAQWVSLGEFSTGNTAAGVGYASQAALVAGAESLVAYCQAAFSPTPCGIWLNFLTGDNFPTSDSVDSLVTWCRDTTGCPFIQELQAPSPYSAQYPLPANLVGPSDNITRWAERSREFSSSAPRMFFIEYPGVTWDTRYNPDDGTTFLKYVADLSSGVAPTTPVYIVFTATNGINASSGAWSGIGSLITSGFLR